MPASCVHPCPLAHSATNETPCPILFYEHCWEQIEAKRLERLVEGKIAYRKKLEAIPADKLANSQHRQLLNITKEINTLVGAIRHLSDLREFYIKEIARLSSKILSLLSENQFLRDELAKAESDLDFMTKQAQRITRQRLTHV